MGEIALSVSKRRSFQTFKERYVLNGLLFLKHRTKNGNNCRHLILLVFLHRPTYGNKMAANHKPLMDEA